MITLTRKTAVYGAGQPETPRAMFAGQPAPVPLVCAVCRRRIDQRGPLCIGSFTSWRSDMTFLYAAHEPCVVMMFGMGRSAATLVHAWLQDEYDEVDCLDLIQATDRMARDFQDAAAALMAEGVQ